MTHGVTLGMGMAIYSNTMGICSYKSYLYIYLRGGLCPVRSPLVHEGPLCNPNVTKGYLSLIEECMMTSIG